MGPALCAHNYGPGPIEGNRAQWAKIIKTSPKIKTEEKTKSGKPVYIDFKSIKLLCNRNKLIDALVMVAIKGRPTRGMPVKGTCTNCTRDDLRAAIDYMLPKKILSKKLGKQCDNAKG